MPSLKDAIDKVSRDLGLPRSDAYGQDWEYELPDEYRTFEWLSRYIDALRTAKYTQDESQILMNLSMDVINDMIGAKDSRVKRAWEMSKDVLCCGNYQDLLDYRASWDTPEDEAFHVSAWVRSFIQSRG